MHGERPESLQDVAVITHVHDGYCISGAAGGPAGGQDGRSPVEITQEVGRGQAGPCGGAAAGLL